MAEPGMYERNVEFLKKHFDLRYGDEGTPYGNNGSVMILVDPWLILHVYSMKSPRQFGISMEERELTEEDIRP